MQHETKIHRQTLVLLGITVVIGALLRIIGLANESLWYDEAASVYLSRVAESPTNLFDTSWNTEAPLHSLLLMLWHALLNMGFQVTNASNDFIYRLMPALSSILAIPLVFLFTRYCTRDNATAQIAAFLYAISPFHIYYAQELRIYSEYVLICLMGVCCQLRALDTNRLRWWAAMVLCFALLMYAHFNSFWIIFTLNVYFLCHYYFKRTHFWTWTLAMSVAMLLMLPALHMAYQVNQMILQIDGQWYQQPGLKTVLVTFKNFFAGYSPNAVAYWLLFVMMLPLAILGGYRLRHTMPKAALPILLALLPLLGNLVLWRMREFSFYEHRLFIFSGVMLLPLIATGIRFFPLFPIRIALLPLVVILTVPCLFDHYRHRIHADELHRMGTFDKVDFRSAARYLENNFVDGDLLAHSSLFTLYSMKHYFPGEHVHLGGEQDAEIYIQYIAFEELLINHQLLPVKIEEATADYDRVWLIQAYGIIFDEKDQSISIPDWLAQNYSVREQEEFNGVRLTLYER